MNRFFPWAPRPFAGEALGGWIGRLAAAYRMTVDELSTYAGLSADACVVNWLAVAPLEVEDQRRLATLCRLSVADLPQAHLTEGLASLTYCYHCLVLNHEDVTAPYWRASWLSAAEEVRCDILGHATQRTSLAVLRDHRNMKALMRFIRRRKASREREARRKEWMLARYLVR